MTMHARVLGVAQDAGVPHIGCDCPRCERFRAAPLWPACLGLVGDEATYLIDATPAIAEQTRLLPRFPGTILLTHVHMGHVAGLLQLGKEALSKKTKVMASPAVCEFLRTNRPWNRLPLDLMDVRDRCVLEPGLEVEWIAVPHRDEDADTHAFLIRGPKKTLLYLPDIDAWEIDLKDLLARCDLALLDGSFFSRDELPRQRDIPHPPITETLALLSDEEACKVRFLHFNHTNPVLDEDGPDVLAAVQGESIPL
ncbi:MAG: MBL fold metallo-hydrolase [Planctomycetota bacterium]|jgi:pyrroloquinoline quinone biosynthesis protein B